MQITDTGISQLGPHYRLTHLDLSNCQQITNDGLNHLRGSAISPDVCVPLHRYGSIQCSMQLGTSEGFIPGCSDPELLHHSFPDHQ